MNRVRKLISGAVLLMLIGVASGCGESKTEEQRMADAAVAYENGQYRAALIELKNVLQENPNNKDARVLLANTSIKIGDADSAAKELERAARLGATPQEIYALQQRTWLKLGSFQELIDNFSDVKASGDEERAEMQLLFAKAQNGLGNTDIAQQRYRALADSDANPRWRSEALIGLSLLARTEGNVEQAIALGEQALALYPESASAPIALGQIAISQARFDDAYAFFKQGQEAAGLTEEERFLMLSGELEASIGTGDIETSKEVANRLFAFAPEHPITSYLLARVAYIAGDKELAFESTQKVLSKYPNFIPAQFLQGALSLERGENPQAEMFLSNVVAAQPNNFEARKLLAESNIRLGNASQAAQILRDGIALGPGAEELMSMLGRVNIRLDNSSDNIAQLEQSLERNPDNEQTRLTLIAAYIAAGRADEALALSESSTSEAVTPERQATIKFIAALQAKDRQAANAQADIILSTWPDNPRTHNMIASWYLSEGMIVKARSTLENAFARNPDFTGLLTNLAKLDAQEGKIADTKTRYEDFLSRNPDNVDAWVSFASIYMVEGDEQGALDVLKRARAAAPNEYMPLAVQTRVLLTFNRVQEALEVAEQAATQFESVAVTQFIYGRALFEAQQYDLALEFIKKADSLRPGDPEIVTYRARTQARMQRFAQAKKSYEELWALVPGTIEAAQSIALLELRSGNTAAANEMLDALKEARPDDVRVMIVEGDIKAESGNFRDAYRLYDQAYAKRPSLDLTLKLDRAAARMGQDGLPVIERWLNQAPEDVAARLVYAQRLQQLGRSNDSIRQYEAVIQQRSDDAIALNNLAWLYFESGASDTQGRAIELAERAYNLLPNNPQIADTYGWILFRSGEVAESLRVLGLAESAARDQGVPDARDIAYHYAAALNESGDRSRARQTLRTILSDESPFQSRESAQQLFDSLARP
ncbi:MAG: XrtA/PEP-CTERM system TPR-repeat protein PrsT [Pseudomonadota bacterium]